jgi:hypothetical protein
MSPLSGNYSLPADFDAWKTGHWGDDDPANREDEPEDGYDPRYDEPPDFDERREEQEW